jgi:hypothetical protein
MSPLKVKVSRRPDEAHDNHREHQARAANLYVLADDLLAAITLIERLERGLFVRRELTKCSAR